MDDEAALLAAIASQPAADVPRLAYADWLDEHGFAIRAEFIRVQHAIKKLEDLPSAEMQGYADLYRRQDAILTTHRRELLGPLSRGLTSTDMHRDVRFDRGFLVELRLDAERFLQFADSIAAIKPAPEITVWDAASFLEPFIALPESTRATITTLVMQSHRRPDPVHLFPEELQQAFGTCYWPRLRRLEMDLCLIGDDGLRELAISENLPALTELDCSSNEITSGGILALVITPMWPRLKSLILDNNPIGDDGAELLADAPQTGLKFLNVRHTALSTAGQQRLLRRKGWNVALF